MCGRRGRQCLLDAIDQLAIAPVGLAQFPQSLQDTLSRKIHRVAAQAGQLRGVSGRDARQGHKLEGLVRFGRDLAAHEVQQDVQQRRLERLLPNFRRRRDIHLAGQFFKRDSASHADSAAPASGRDALVGTRRRPAVRDRRQAAAPRRIAPASGAGHAGIGADARSPRGPQGQDAVGALCRGRTDRCDHVAASRRSSGRTVAGHRQRKRGRIPGCAKRFCGSLHRRPAGRLVRLPAAADRTRKST